MIDKQVNESPLKIFAGVTKLFVLLTGARPEVECHGELTGVSPYSVTTHQPVTTISLPSKTLIIYRVFCKTVYFICQSQIEYKMLATKFTLEPSLFCTQYK